MCAPSSPLSPLGVALSDGQLEVLVAPCSGQGFSKVSVYDIADGDQFPRKKDLIWQIRSDAPGTLDHVVVGEVPPGFQETVALREDDGEDLVVDVGDSVYFMSFDRDELSEGEVFTEEGLVSWEEFAQEYVAHACRTRGAP